MIVPGYPECESRGTSDAVLWSWSEVSACVSAMHLHSECGWSQCPSGSCLVMDEDLHLWQGWRWVIIYSVSQKGHFIEHLDSKYV